MKQPNLHKPIESSLRTRARMPEVGRLNVRALLVRMAALIWWPFIGTVLAAGDSTTPPIFNYDPISKNLSQKAVKCLEKDAQGFLWIGTEYGLNRYDGFTLKKFHKNQSENLWLGGNYINSLHADDQNGLWIVSHGLSLISTTEKKQVHLLPQTSKNPLYDASVRTLVSQGQGEIFFGTTEGLFSYDVLKDLVTAVPGPSSLDQPLVNCLTASPSGVLWVGLKYGLGLKQPNDKSRFHHLEFTSHLGKVTSITEIENRILIIGTEGRGLWLVNGQRVLRLALDSDFDLAMSVSAVTTLSENDLLVATNKGLFFVQIDPQQGKVLRCVLVLNVATHALLKDPTGVIWAGTEVGLFRTSEMDLLTTVTLDQVNPNLRTASVRSFCWLSTSELIVGTDTGQPLLYDFEQGSLELLSTRFPGLASLNREKLIRSILIDRNRNLWIGSSNGIILVENLLKKPVKMTRFFPNLVIRVFTQLGDGRILVGTEGKGIFVIDTNSMKPRPIRLTSPLLSNPFVNCIAVKDSEAIILGTSDGLDYLDFNGEVTARIRFNSGREDLESNFILSTWLMPSGALWVGTANGLFKVEAGQLTVCLTTKEGLPSNFVTGLLGDGSDHLWGSTLNGIFRIETESNHLEIFSPAINEIPEYKVGAATTGANHRMVFGGIGGFTIANAHLARSNDIPPKTHITDLFVIDSRATGSKMQINAFGTLPHSELVLEPYQNPVIHFTGIHNLNPKKNRFRYRLTGYETGWTEVDALSRIARYPQLPWGRYVFEVFASNPDGIWDASGAQLRLIKMPPWWWRTSTKVVYGFILGLVLIGTFFLIQRRNRSRERKKRLAVHNHQLRELGQFATAITHDLNGFLASIAGFTSLALQETQKETKVRHHLEKIESAWRNGHDLVAQIGLFGKKKTEICEVCDLVDILQETLDMVGVSCPQTTRISVDLQVRSAWVLGSKTELLQVFANLFQNAIHACGESEGFIEISLKATLRDKNPAYQITLQDNGLGMDEAVLLNVFKPFFTTKKEKGLGLGLAVVKGVIDALGGEINIQSKPAVGTKVCIVLSQSAPELTQSKHGLPFLPSKGDGHKRIVWIDDDRHYLKLGVSNLRKLGYDAVGSNNGPEAEALFAIEPFAYDLIVVDSGGLETKTWKMIKDLAATQPLLQIVWCSAYSSLEAELSLPEHAIIHLKKPFNTSDICKVFRPATEKGGPIIHS